MASLNLQTFTQLVQSQAAAIQGRAAQLVDFSVGSILRAIAEGNAGLALWLQGLISQVLTLTRAATSSGSDLDSWMADYSLTRLAATLATGTVTFSSLTASPSLTPSSPQAVVPVGAQVRTGDNSQTFLVTQDITNSGWSTSAVPGGGYVMPAGTLSVTVPVQAVTPGTGGNVVAGAISTLLSVIEGVDLVTNTAAFTDAMDAETDTALRTRFALYIASLSKATKTAVGAAVGQVQQGLSWSLTEAQSYAGQTTPGSFYLVVDDGSGNPPSSLIAEVYAAVDAVRPVGTSFAVFGPTRIAANVGMTLITATGYTHATVVGQVATALATLVNGLATGATLPYSQLAAVAWSVPGIVNVTGITLQGGTSDLVATNQQVIRAGLITVN